VFTVQRATEGKLCVPCSKGGRLGIKQGGQCCRCLEGGNRQDGREGILSTQLEVKILGATEVLF